MPSRPNDTSAPPVLCGPSPTIPDHHEAQPCVSLMVRIISDSVAYGSIASALTIQMSVFGAEPAANEEHAEMIPVIGMVLMRTDLALSFRSDVNLSIPGADIRASQRELISIGNSAAFKNWNSFVLNEANMELLERPGEGPHFETGIGGSYRMSGL